MIRISLYISIPYITSVYPRRRFPLNLPSPWGIIIEETHTKTEIERRREALCPDVAYLAAVVVRELKRASENTDMMSMAMRTFLCAIWMNVTYRLTM